MSFTLGTFVRVAGAGGHAPAIYCYSTLDTAEECEVEGYFNDVADLLRSGDVVTGYFDRGGTPAFGQMGITITDGVVTAELVSAPSGGGGFTYAPDYVTPFATHDEEDADYTGIEVAIASLPVGYATAKSVRVRATLTSLVGADLWVGSCHAAGEFSSGADWNDAVKFEFADAASDYAQEFECPVIAGKIYYAVSQTSLGEGFTHGLNLHLIGHTD